LERGEGGGGGERKEAKIFNGLVHLLLGVGRMSINEDRLMTSTLSLEGQDKLRRERGGGWEHCPGRLLQP